MRTVTVQYQSHCTGAIVAIRNRGRVGRVYLNVSESSLCRILDLVFNDSQWFVKPLSDGLAALCLAHNGR